MFSIPYRNVGFIRGVQSSPTTFCVSLWDVGSTRHADIQASAVAMTHRLLFMPVLGDCHFLPLSVKQEQYNLLARKVTAHPILSSQRDIPGGE